MVSFTDDFLTFDTSRWDLSGGVATVVNEMLSVNLPNIAIKVKSTSSDLPLANSQEAIAAFMSTTQASDAFGIVWVRYDLTSLRFGYGLQLAWNADGTRTVNLIKVNYATLALDIVDTATAVFLSHDGTDLGVIQAARIIAFDNADGSVIVRGYLNEEDEGLPIVEFEDHGNGISNPPNRGIYSYGFAFGAANTLQLDTFEASDQYQVPAFGAYQVGYRTLAELRTELLLTLQGSSSTNNADALYNSHLNQAMAQEIRRLGDRAMFLRRFKEMPTEIDQDGLYVMGHDVGRVLEIFDSTTKRPIAFFLVGTQTDGRLRMQLGDKPRGNLFIRYMQRYEPMRLDTDTCAFPHAYDEVVILSASLRSVTSNRDKELFGALTERYKLSFASMESEMSAFNRQTRAQFFVDGPGPYYGDFDSPVPDFLRQNTW